MRKRFLYIFAATLGAMAFVHPFGAVKERHSTRFLQGLPDEDRAALGLLERACQNCHSERTEWPVYSYVPLVSWAVEKDVADARREANLSHWDAYSADQQRDLLTRMGAVVRNRRMPLPRYLILHPEARLSDEEIRTIYEWTRAQRNILRNRGNK